MSELIGAIYDCAIRPDLWESTLSAVASSLACGKAMLSLNDLTNDKSLINQSIGWQPAWLRERERHLPEIHSVLNAWLDASGGDHEPFVGSRVLSQEQFSQSRYVADCLAPQNITDAAHFVLMRSQCYFSEFVLFKEAPHPFMAADEIERAKLLKPHLQRAVTISKLLEVQSIAASSMEVVLDSLSSAVVLVTGHLDIVYANRSAEELIRQEELLIAQGGRLKLCSVGATVALTNAVKQAVSDELWMGRKGNGVPIITQGGLRSVFHVLPLHRSAIRANLMPSAIAAVFVSPTTCHDLEMNTALAALFELTPSEMSVLSRILMGETLGEVAAALGLKLSTIKTHTQALFNKTGVRRQSELLRLISSFSVPLRKPGAN